MASSITKKQLKQMPVIPYEKVRDHIKTGNIFFSSGSYAFPGVIQRLTKSTWSHVAVVYKDEELGRVMVLEAEPSVGVRLIPVSKYLRNYKDKNRPYKGQIAIAKLNIDVEKEKLNRGISFGLDELARPYDNFLDCENNGAYFISHQPQRKKQKLYLQRTGERRFCKVGDNNTIQRHLH